MSRKQEYTIEVKESNEIILTFKNPDTEETQSGSIRIEDPDYRDKFLGLIQFPLEEFKFGLYKDSITPQDIFDMVAHQIKLQGKSKPVK